MDLLAILKDYFNRIKRRLILNGYYTCQIKDGKSLGAAFIDWFFISLIIVLFFYITIFNSTQNISVTLILTFVLLFIYLFLLIYIKGKVREKSIFKIDEKIKDEQIRKRIEKWNYEDFSLFIKGMLEKYYETSFFHGDSNIDFIGKINDEVYGVKCIKGSWDDKIHLKDIEGFIGEMKNRNIHEGIIVTNSNFDQDIKEHIDYMMMDFEYIKHVLKEIGEFPTKEDVEDLIISEHETRKKDLKEGFSINRRDKIYKFLLLSLVLYITSSYVTYSLYYRVMAFISFTLGTFIGIYNLAKYMKRTRENRL